MKGRAIAFVEALMKVLVAMRVPVIFCSMLTPFVIILVLTVLRLWPRIEHLFVMANMQLALRVCQVILEPITNYLSTLPGYNKERKQVSQVFEQHGYITMQLTRVFASLADTYGHILRTGLAMDLKDVVLNRRLMVVLLPALKVTDELSNLGKGLFLL